jgi:hypothetical protein
LYVAFVKLQHIVELNVSSQIGIGIKSIVSLQ